MWLLAGLFSAVELFLNQDIEILRETRHAKGLAFDSKHLEIWVCD